MAALIKSPDDTMTPPNRGPRAQIDKELAMDERNERPPKRNAKRRITRPLQSDYGGTSDDVDRSVEDLERDDTIVPEPQRPIGKDTTPLTVQQVLSLLIYLLCCA